MMGGRVQQFSAENKNRVSASRVLLLKDAGDDECWRSV